MKIKSLIALALVFCLCLPLCFGCAKTSSQESDTTSSVTTDKKDTDENKASVSLATQATTEAVSYPTDDTELFENKNDVFNILLLGIDEMNDLGISDTILLLSVNKAQKEIKLTSFMRDTYVNIPGYYPHKLNLAYALGGSQLVTDTIRSNFGIDIHRYALMNYITFVDVIDILGGVEINLTSDEIGYINDMMKVNGESDVITLKEGVVTLNGKQALSHARNRGGQVGGNTYTGSDWERTARQRALMSALVEKFSDVSAAEIMQLAVKVLPSVNTDLTMEELSLIMANIKTYLGYNVEASTVPADGTWKYNYNDAGSIIEIEDWGKATDELEKFIYEK